MKNPVIECLKRRYVSLAEFPFATYSASLNMEDLSDAFHAFLNTPGKDCDRQLLRDHLLLGVEYSLLCQQLITQLSTLRLPDAAEAHEAEIEQIKNQLLGAFILAQLIEHINRHFLPRDLTKIRNQQDVLKYLLSNPNTPGEDLDINPLNPSLANRVRDLTGRATWYRLFLVRSKRLIEIIAKFVTGWQHFQNVAALLTRYGTPVIGYLAWCFFIPRFLVNLISLGRHTIPCFLSEKEKTVGFWDRLRAQLIQRWPEIGNDIPWLIVGVTNWMVLVGALSPFAATLTLVFYGYDVMIASVRAMVELSRLHQLKEEYKALKNSDNHDPINQAVDDFEFSLNDRIKFEQRRLGVNVIATLGIFLGGVCALAIFACCPVIPLMGAIISLAVSLFIFATERMLSRIRPRDNPEGLTAGSDFKLLRSRLGFFADPKQGLSPLNTECETPRSQALNLHSPDSAFNAWGSGSPLPSPV